MASVAFFRAVTLFYGENMQRAVEEYAARPESWRRATTFSDYALRLTAEEARSLVDELHALLGSYRAYDQPGGPDDAELFHVQFQAFPLPGD